MVVVPEVIPVTIPVAGVTDAMITLSLVHVPPGVVLDNVVVRPTHTSAIPSIGAGRPLIVTTMEALQPVPIAYVMATVPAEAPVTTPEVASTVATVISLLDHAPPLIALLRVVVSPTHVTGVPLIAPGVGFTVSVTVE